MHYSQIRAISAYSVLIVSACRFEFNVVQLLAAHLFCLGLRHFGTLYLQKFYINLII